MHAWICKYTCTDRHIMVSPCEHLFVEQSQSSPRALVSSTSHTRFSHTWLLSWNEGGGLVDVVRKLLLESGASDKMNSSGGNRDRDTRGDRCVARTELDCEVSRYSKTMCFVSINEQRFVAAGAVQDDVRVGVGCHREREW